MKTILLASFAETTNCKRCELSVSLAPGFSRVFSWRKAMSRFNGLFRAGKPLKWLCAFCASNTGLKPGANEIRYSILRASIILAGLLAIAPVGWCDYVEKPDTNTNYVAEPILPA